MRYEDVVGYESLYSVTADGHVFAKLRLGISTKGNVFLHEEHEVAVTTRKNGYRQVHLWKNGKNRTFYVHRLVAEAFLANPNNLPQVNHKDKDRANNDVGNLEYVTARGNMQHSSSTSKHSSRFVGVTWCKERHKWQAQYQVGKRNVFIGRFATQEEAHEAYANWTDNGKQYK